MSSDESVLMIAGTPVQCGTQLFTKLVMDPLFGAANSMPVEAQVQLFAGFMSGFFGAMAGQFGHQRALELFRTSLEVFTTMPPMDDTPKPNAPSSGRVQ